MLEYTVKVYDDNSEEWFLDGKRHRLNGPAVTFVNRGFRAWWVNGKRHRLNGPAVICTINNHKEWWINGIEVTEERVMNSIPYYSNANRE